MILSLSSVRSRLGGGSWRLRVRAAWRQSEVRPAAAAPLPQTSPIDHRPAPAGLEDVVEVAAHLVAVAARREAGRGLEALDLGQLAGQQALLERARDAALVLEQARVVDRQARAARELAHERPGAVVEPAPRRPHGERQRPQLAPAGAQRRHDDGGRVGLGAQRGHPFGLVGREVRGRHDLGASQPVHGLDGAEIGQAGYHEIGEAREALIHPERRVQRLANLRQERDSALRAHPVA